MMYWEYYLLGIILLPGIILGMWAQFRVEYNFAKYSKVMSKKGVSGAEVARLILNTAGLYDYKVERVSGRLSDHFNPRTKTVSLSSEVHDSSSVASLGIACHEVGHALQYASNYAPIKVRNAIITVSNATSAILWPIVILGLVLDIAYASTLGTVFLWCGVAFFGLSVLINLVTLPVEFNASSRAKTLLSKSEICDSEEMVGVNKVLNSAALTYVAALVVSILNLLRFVIVILSSKRRD